MRLNCSWDCALHPGYVDRNTSAALQNSPPVHPASSIASFSKKSANVPDHASNISIALRACCSFPVTYHCITWLFAAFALSESSTPPCSPAAYAPRITCTNGFGLKSSDARGLVSHTFQEDVHGSSPALILAFINSRSERVCKMPG